ncbi:hypothetical protein K435DRAFT_809660 [Dendrothele bispora CBS 962.96]|uniref:Uncharacterized protein n=1 Tax=Dendrothele bispora (strain CBS 962.96) TaxID=1314807 RepID=A0A4S8KXJ4_DENBC|nr:hypothetical protein K435DRAFT_809660 [Dendrothele bispora CBS 962.96]
MRKLKGGTAVFIPSIITKSEEFEEEKDEKLERKMAREKGRSWVSIRGATPNWKEKLKRSERAFEAVAYLKAEGECQIAKLPWSAVRVGTKSSEKKALELKSDALVLKLYRWEKEMGSEENLVNMQSKLIYAMGFRVNETDSVDYTRPVVSLDRHMAYEEEVGLFKMYWMNKC